MTDVLIEDCVRALSLRIRHLEEYIMLSASAGAPTESKEENP